MAPEEGVKGKNYIRSIDELPDDSIAKIINSTNYTFLRPTHSETKEGFIDKFVNAGDDIKLEMLQYARTNFQNILNGNNFVLDHINRNTYNALKQQLQDLLARSSTSQREDVAEESQDEIVPRTSRKKSLAKEIVKSNDTHPKEQLDKSVKSRAIEGVEYSEDESRRPSSLDKEHVRK